MTHSGKKFINVSKASEMAIEIERKFLVRGKPWAGMHGTRYRQGYLSTDPERSVRVRIAGDEATLTIKGRSQGASRTEFEYPIPQDDAEQLLDQLCIKSQIEKIRYRLDYAGLTWELDVFLGENAGLAIAEVELDNLGQSIENPPWIDREVTGDKRFFNAYLTEHPYSTWSDIPFL
jgi:adenylate cyclase